MILPDFIRWCDLRGVLGVREGFLAKDFLRLAIGYGIPCLDELGCNVRLLAPKPRFTPEAYFTPKPEQTAEAAPEAEAALPTAGKDESLGLFTSDVLIDLSTEEGQRKFEQLQFETWKTIRALMAKPEPVSAEARAYLEAERQKIQAAKEEAEQAKAEAEAASAREALFEQVRAAGKKVIQGRPGDGQGKGRGHEPDAYAALNEVHHVPYKTIVRAFFEGAGVSNPSDAELEKEEANLRAVVSKERRKRKRPSAKGD